MPVSSSSRASYQRKAVKKLVPKKKTTVNKRQLKPMEDVRCGFIDRYNGTNRLLRNYPIPVMQVATHAYTANMVSLATPGSGLNGTPYYFRLNDLFAPDFTGTTFGPHQPYGYDSMRSFYEKSTVIKAKVTIRTLSSSDRFAAIIAFVKKQTDVADPSGQTATQWVEKPNAWVISSGNTSMPYNSWTATFDIAKQMGLTQAKLLNDDDYSSKGNSSPSGNASLLIGVSGGAFDLTPSTIDFVFSIEYTAVWQNPVTQQSS